MWRKSSDDADGRDFPWTEAELEKEYKVEFIRTPRDERLVLKNPKFLGPFRIWNTKRGREYWAYVWFVDFLRANAKDFDNPLPGLMQIRTKIWKNACLGLKPSDLKGKVELTADNARQIVSIRNDLV
jgi:hypothetical protein